VKLRLGYWNTSLVGLPAYISSASVGHQWGSTARLQRVSLRSHHGQSNQPSLAPCLPQSAVQDAHVQSLAWIYVDTPQSTSSCRWSTCSRRSTRTSCLQVPSDRLSTVDGRALSVSGPTIWNNLPDHVTSAPSLPTFRRLKNFLFSIVFPDTILDNSYLHLLLITDPGVIFIRPIWTTLNIFINWLSYFYTTCRCLLYHAGYAKPVRLHFYLLSKASKPSRWNYGGIVPLISSENFL